MILFGGIQEDQTVQNKVNERWITAHVVDRRNTATQEMEQILT